MSSFTPTLCFQSYETAVNSIARIARVQGFRIHQRKGPQKSLYDQQGVASFGCAAAGCGWFVTIRRTPADGPSTSTAPPTQWTVYTLYDSHKSTCKPARSRRRRPSLSSISSLETDDDLPPELLRPYERSPSLPVLMHARDLQLQRDASALTSATAATSLPPQETLHQQNEYGTAPSYGVATDDEIRELLASLGTAGADYPASNGHLDLHHQLSKEPLALPQNFAFGDNNYLDPGSQPVASTSTSNQYWPFMQNGSEASAPLQNGLPDWMKEFDSLPDRLQRGASILNTINPSDLMSPPKTNGFFESAHAAGHAHKSANPTVGQPNGHSAEVEDTHKVARDVYDWTDSDSEPEDLDQDEELDVQGAANPRETSVANHWQTTNAIIDSVYQEDDMPYGSPQDSPATDAETSSSDSDIPLDQLVNTNRSLSNLNTSQNGCNLPFGIYDGGNHYHDEQDYSGPSEQNHPMPKTGPARSVRASRATRQPAAASINVVHEEPDSPFDMYQHWATFEDAETAILNDARLKELPLKIRYRPHMVGKTVDARRQASLECMRHCGYRITLKDDRNFKWRVTEVLGAHKQNCYPSRRTKGKVPAVRRGTQPFRNGRNREEEMSMEVAIPVWNHNASSSRRRRSSSYSTDRSSSPTIQVVTHSDTFMRTIKTAPIGATPPPEVYADYARTSSSSKGKGKASRQSRALPKVIEIDDSDDDYHAPSDDELQTRPSARPQRKTQRPMNGYMTDSQPAAEPMAFARKKLPTQEQLVTSAKKKDHRPPHKIPTRPNGRSPFKNRERKAARDAAAAAAHSSPLAYPYAPTLSAKSRRHIERPLGAESSDDEDNQLGLARSQSSRALRSAKRASAANSAARTSRGHSSHINGHNDPDWASGLPSPHKKRKLAAKNLPTAKPSARVQRIPRSQYKNGIHPHLRNRMTLYQAGFSEVEVRFLARGGYSTISQLTREGLVCNNDDFSVFKSWLGDCTFPVHIAGNPQTAKAYVKQRVASVVEQVRVGAAFAWEAAGMMSEGSDAYNEGSEPENHPANGQNGGLANGDVTRETQDRIDDTRQKASAYAKGKKSARRSNKRVRSDDEIAAPDYSEYGQYNGNYSASSSVEFLG